MRAAFKEKPARPAIDKAGLTDIHTRLFGKPDPKMVKDELDRRIKTFGSCQCDDKSCREPFKGYCEYDHHYLHAGSSEGDVIEWRALTKMCHAKKTRTRDTPHAAKLKRTARKYNPDYAEPEKPKHSRKMQGRGFDKTLTKGFDGKVRKRA